MAKLTDTQLLDYIEGTLADAVEDYSRWAEEETAASKAAEEDDSGDPEYYKGRATAFAAAVTRFRAILHTTRRHRPTH